MEKDQAGRTWLITGANTGIGRVTALALARRGARVWMAGRSRERTQPVVDEMRALGGERAAEFVPLDLTRLESVRECARTFLSSGEPLHGLINNAGLAGVQGLTHDGFEMHFGVNHLGHFLLTDLLLDALKKHARSRIVIVASRAHQRVKRLDLDAMRRSASSRSGFMEYSASKLCNLLHARELARRLQGTGVTVYALHPGVVASDIWREVPWPIRSLMHLFMIDNEQGAKTTIWCATEPSLSSESGRYYDKCRAIEPRGLGTDDALAAKLWERSMEWTAPYRAST